MTNSTDQEKFAAYVEFTLTDDHKSNPVLTFGEWLNAGKPEAPKRERRTCIPS